MDAKQYVREFLRAHQGITYSQNELAAEINEYRNFEIPLKVHPEEVLKYGRELAQEDEKIHHYVVSAATTVSIGEETRTLFDDDEYLRYDVVADLAPDRLDEVEGMACKELREWIIDELADTVIDDLPEHQFEYEGRGWGGPD